ncbi:polyribonucleotide nucleotidyltransferase [Candidatus Kaiserbacteria bacterium CG10_big_fil_rev_8_21_14_0_10_43_70]|uniref:Polyribonucleotide nucleotidyltransferase n=1 Tax=Candidatus Kaiserbacteria bacterium CG10_big_fil_rev_8_21_14_0_10_43_70 TaxID=1974605 RepID=A0A2H0UL50_9BACT|nr:MAG: polyribonucleotide nucleotidyltransferase [Candidatus Kaiserbacteria bacterium CG10_big_fil_rev_8_21_14_0_10_43_70]
MQKKEYSMELGGKTLTAEFTDIADQANGSVIIRYGNSAILATAVMGGERSGLDYFPLSVEYEEKFYAAGAILGSRFQRREGRPSDEAILSARVVDRTIRPLFDHHIRRDVQVVITVLSIDEDDTDVLGVMGASLALGTSDIPWNGPVSAVRIGKNGGDKLIINPTYKERGEETHMDLLACGKDGHINMIEIGASEADESTIQLGLKKAAEIHSELQEFQEKIISEIGKEKKKIETREVSNEIKELFEKEIEPNMLNEVFGGNGSYALKDKWIKKVSEEIEGVSLADAGDYFEEMIDQLVHDEAISNNRRQDGRKMDEIRPLYAQAGGISGMIHGTGLFYRGGTHVLSALTLGGPEDAQLLDTIEFQDTKKKYMHHYNFPPFSVGETGRVGGFNRRMIGHGALAEKAIIPVLPSIEEFPYTIRIVSETMASNGSSSMASVCGSTLALLDAGVPIKKPVAGIAMGMMSDEKGNHKILTDIQGPEDHHGDMDFKVAGTREGVTAVQMDVKVSGVPIDVLMEAFSDAKKAILAILDVIEKEIDKPRENIHKRAPKILTLSVKEDQIGLVIGPGGKTINGIKDATGVTDINIDDDGTVYITGNGGTAQEAYRMISELTHEYKVGEKFENATVTRIMDFGAFVKIGTNTEGLVHISEIAPFRINTVSEILSEGEQVAVIIKEIDEKNRINLSIKDIDPEFAIKKGVKPMSSQTQNGGGKEKPEQKS